MVIGSSAPLLPPIRQERERKGAYESVIHTLKSLNNFVYRTGGTIAQLAEGGKKERIKTLSEQKQRHMRQ